MSSTQNSRIQACRDSAEVACANFHPTYSSWPYIRESEMRSGCDRAVGAVGCSPVISEAAAAAALARANEAEEKKREARAKDERRRKAAKRAEEEEIETMKKAAAAAKQESRQRVTKDHMEDHVHHRGVRPKEKTLEYHSQSAQSNAQQNTPVTTEIKQSSKYSSEKEIVSQRGIEALNPPTFSNTPLTITTTARIVTLMAKGSNLPITTTTKYNSRSNRELQHVLPQEG
ncbi:hypothetical protein O3P69_008475 [Scylla paramamosain]|uniref:Uncharacterized protein n=1 Tax=Scylla paramamosain TaxID=85552 RepID=A0AAW0SK81_SCYPA